MDTFIKKSAIYLTPLLCCAFLSADEIIMQVNVKTLQDKLSHYRQSQEETLLQESIEPPMDEVKETKTESKEFIEATLIGRTMSNKTFFSNSPYAFVLFDTEYGDDTWKISGGVYGQKGLPHPDLPINHLYVDYFGDNVHVKVGKMVSKIGVLDYLSMVDTLNPIRYEFFDDPKMTIKKIPLWMGQVDIFLTDEMKISLFVQPYDNKYQDYTGFYTNYVINQFVPQHYQEFFNQDPIGQEIFSPLYTNAISPFLSHDIESKRPSRSLKAQNSSLGFVSEYTNDYGKMGILYFNRYSEVPLIRVDQNLLNAALKYENGQSSAPDLTNYIASLDLDPIKSVEGFRYQQAGIYGETTTDSYGIRGEVAYRDKVPLLNNYGSITSLGLAIDHLTPSVYYSLETQYIHLSQYNKDAMIAMMTTKFEPIRWSLFRGHFENRLIAAHVDTMNDISINPSFTLEYDRTDLVIQGIVSEHNSATNTLSILIRSVF